MRISWTLTTAILALLSSSASADELRTVVLRLPAKDAAKFRQQLSKQQATQVAIDPLLKSPGVDTVLDKLEKGPEVCGKGSGVPDQRELQPDRLPPPVFEGTHEIERRVSIMPSKSHAGVLLHVGVDLEFPEGRDACVSFRGRTDLYMQPGRWKEVMAWKDMKFEGMVWQYGSVEGLPPPPPGPQAAEAKPLGNASMALKFFRAKDTELLRKAGTNTRDRALEWLASRGELWRECNYAFSNSPGKLCGFKEMKMDRDGAMVVRDVSVEWTLREEGGERVSGGWKVTTEDGEKSSVREVQVDLDPGIWNFVPVEGVSEFNVIACRISEP